MEAEALSLLELTRLRALTALLMLDGSEVTRLVTGSSFPRPEVICHKPTFVCVFLSGYHRWWQVISFARLHPIRLPRQPIRVGHANVPALFVTLWWMFPPWGHPLLDARARLTLGKDLVREIVGLDRRSTLTCTPYHGVDP